MASKRMKKLRKRVRRAAAGALAIGAPIAGSILGGTAGAAIGTAAGRIGSKLAPSKASRARFRELSMAFGGGLTAASGAAALATGSGLTTSLPTMLSKLFGGATGAPGTETEGTEPLPQPNILSSAADLAKLPPEVRTYIEAAASDIYGPTSRPVTETDSGYEGGGDEGVPTPKPGIPPVLLFGGLGVGALVLVMLARGGGSKRKAA